MMHTASVLSTVIIFSLLYFFGCSPSYAFTITIGPSRQKCFHEIASEGHKIYGSYAVQFGGKLDINIQILDPEDKNVFYETEAQEGSFEFIAQQNGRYSLCLNNERVSVSTKRVSFSYRVADEIKKAGLHASKYFGSLEAAVSDISIGVSSIQDHHHYMTIRDKFARTTNESTLSRVWWMSFFEIIVILCLCAFQLSYMVRLFNK
mmetsp:Transcript_31489/g.51001  ORF Transcript_31489/g.51001 Transcript_31489/m.51001 type:complete len:205 (+) Transcript_31489:74-688(+)